MKRVCLLVAMLAAMVLASTANAWSAVVAASAKCNVQTGVYDVTASVVSSEPSGAVVKSYSPKTFPGNTTGSQKVYVTADWPNNSEEPTYTVYVQLNGTCVAICEPVVTERIVYVDRPVEVVREVEKRVEVPVEKIVIQEKIVEKPVVKTVVKWKVRTVVKWKTRTVVKRIIITKIVHDRCPPPPVCCEGKG